MRVHPLAKTLIAVSAFIGISTAGQFAVADALVSAYEGTHDMRSDAYTHLTDKTSDNATDYRGLAGFDDAVAATELAEHERIDAVRADLTRAVPSELVRLQFDDRVAALDDFELTTRERIEVEVSFAIHVGTIRICELGLAEDRATVEDAVNLAEVLLISVDESELASTVGAILFELSC